MQPISTRDRMIELLRLHGPLTAADLVSFLEVTPTAVRQHLGRLEAEGWAELVGLRRGRGRPRKLYALTAGADRLFPQSYDALAMDLLESISRLPDGDKLLDRVLHARREIWKERYAQRLAAKPLDQQLHEITNLFNEKGGLTECEAQPDGTFLLTKRNCNIATVSAKYPRFCQEEGAWLQDVLETPVEALQSRAKGDASCAFRIRPTAASSGDTLAHLAEKGE